MWRRFERALRARTALTGVVGGRTSRWRASLVRDPHAVLGCARTNLARLQGLHPRGRGATWLSEWEKLLDGPIDDVLDVLTSQTSRSRELRANSPFAGVLSSEEREQALLAFQSYRQSRVWMTRDQLAHILRAAARIANDDEIIVIGSQAILGLSTKTTSPEPVHASIEVDVFFAKDPDLAKTDGVDGHLGEGSHFTKRSATTPKVAT